MRVAFGAVGLVLCAMAALAGCSRRTASGTYIAKFTNGVQMLQIVETPDHHVTGQLQGVYYDKNAKIENMTATVTGAVDGSNISLVIKPTSFLSNLLSPGVTESGTFNSDRLTLTGKLAGPTAQTITFLRSTVEEFQTLAKVVENHAAQVAEAIAKAKEERRKAQAEAAAFEQAMRREREISAALDVLVQRMERFHAEADSFIAKIPRIETRYRSITSKMNQYLDRERSLRGVPNAVAARGQLAVAVNQGTVATEQLHNNVQPSQWAFDNNARPLLQNVNAAEHACRANSEQIRSESEAHRKQCARLLEAVPGFRKHFKALAKGLTGLEAAYRKEKGNQQKMVNEADRIE